MKPKKSSLSSEFFIIIKVFEVLPKKIQNDLYVFVCITKEVNLEQIDKEKRIYLCIRTEHLEYPLKTLF